MNWTSFIRSSTPCLRSRSTQPISDEEFARRLADATQEEVDEETTARILAAEAERGEIISHRELKQRLGL